jgi:parvulin-like peptidyl-prolyl isomerase
MVPAFADVAFGLKTSEISDVVVTSSACTSSS